MAESLPNNGDVKKEFVGEAPNRPYKWKVGNTFATALTGFVAGVLAATIVLYPWLKYLGDLCPNTPQSRVTTGNAETFHEEAPPAVQPAP